MGHTNFVGAPINKKRHDTGHPKCLVCALADVPAGAPLLKVYAYGPFGARFFWGRHHSDWLYGGTAIGAKRDRFCMETAHSLRARPVGQHQMVIECAFASMTPASHPDNFQSYD